MLVSAIVFENSKLLTKCTLQEYTTSTATLYVAGHLVVGRRRVSVIQNDVDFARIWTRKQNLATAVYRCAMESVIKLGLKRWAQVLRLEQSEELVYEPRAPRALV